MPSRILISALIASATAAHGGPVVARRHAAALVRRGFQVCVAAPLGEPSGDDGFAVEIYPARASLRDPFTTRRHDDIAVAQLRGLMQRFRPHVLYDVHGPAWAVEAASEAGIPVVSMMGDYNWFCLQSFLVNSRVERCPGPGNGEKCFPCVNRWHRLPQRVANVALRPAAKAGMISLPVWDKLTEATDYLARMRMRISKFVVGDRKAYEFLVDHGISTSKIARIAQGLPVNALVPRARALETAPAGRNLRFGFVGRADADKGLAVLARAFDSLPRQMPVELWIIHKDEARYEYLKRLFPSRVRFTSDLARGRIRLLRPQTQDEVFGLMSQVDVGVVPSIAYESPCLAMLEFVAQGTPIIRSESLGMQHVIQDGVNGRTFPYGDWKTLAHAMDEVVSHPELIARWRGALPRIQSDDEYARQLAMVFDAERPGPEAAVRTRRTLEELHA